MRNPFSRKPRHDYDTYEDAHDGGFYRGDEEDEDGIVGELDGEPMPAAPRKPASAPTGQIKIVKPRSYQDSAMIADYLMDGYTVVLNVEELERPAVTRMADYLFGVIHVLGGDMRRASKTTLVFTPHPNGEEGDDEEDDGDI